jgi:hypothetical protein
VSEDHHAAVQAAIATSGDSFRWPDPQFDRLAQRLFGHQFTGCAPYAHYCRGRGVKPDTISTWRDIPAVPTDVFKSVALATFPPDEAVATFLTSGTTVGTRGRHLLRTLSTYEASLAPWLRRWLAPDDVPLVLALAPSFEDDLHSSLGYMISWAVRNVGGPGSRHCWSDGPDLDAFAEAVRSADRAVLVLGTARALQHLLEERLIQSPLRLPPGSRVMETGGFKGAARTLSRDDFYGGLAAGLVISEDAVISEYGMTELASQGYARGTRQLVFPPWCRVGAVDPDTLALLPDGERGLLRFWDLANVDSVLAIQTADVGVVSDAGVLLEGRAPGATPRGCSLAVDEILRQVGS